MFVDFWNYTLSMRAVDEAHQSDWRKLGPVLADEAANEVLGSRDGEYQGMNFFGSYNPATEKNLHRWATTVVDTFPGVQVSMVPRQKKRSPPRALHAMRKSHTVWSAVPI